EEFAIYRVPLSERVSRLTEGVEIVKRLWTEDRVTHNGRHWQFSEVGILPRPLQRPRPPILIGAQVDAAIARAAKISDGWLVVPQPKTEELPAQVKLFRETRAAAGLPASPHICRLYEVACAASEAEAYRRAARHLLEKYAA